MVVTINRVGTVKIFDSLSFIGKTFILIVDVFFLSIFF